MSTFDKMQEQYREMQEALKRDIRPMISRANGYNPEKDQFKEWEYKEYPKIIHNIVDKNGIITPDITVHSREEENRVLGRKPEPAKAATVDISNLGQNETVRVKRKYTKKAERQPLPPNLE